MTQTRTFLLFALMAVAYLLWMAWEKDYGPHPASPSASGPAAAAASGPAGDVPVSAASVAAAVPAGTAPSVAGRRVTLSNDVLRLTIDSRGGTLVRAELLRYPEVAPSKREPHPPPVRLFDDAAERYYVAQSGLVSAQGVAPDHRAVFAVAQGDVGLAPGADEASVVLTWQDAAGLKVSKTYALKRGSYVVHLTQALENTGAAPWQGNAYTQLQRVAPPKVSGWLANFTNPSANSFTGAGWYSPEEKFDALSFADFAKKPLQRQVTGGWIAMLQHYFFAAWIPAANEPQTFASGVLHPESAQPTYLVRAVGPALTVAPGQRLATEARLYAGPKLQGQLDAIAPGLELTTNYGWLTAIAQPLHWLLSKLHALCGNWGVAIILLVLLLKAALWKLTAAQFRSGARMRKLQPRMQALRERYGDDKLKLQQAMMELYKKEKINPMAGCLPILVTFPVFLGLYRVLMESVELRQAPFFGWIHDLSAPDPYFVLPALYVLVMLATQWLTPTTGMDPAQAKMMKVMPILFAVMFAFFPSGLVLYWVVNGATSLAQQWFITRQVERAEQPARAA
ncbi:MAG: membrane protein insertase YidC [Sinobacteraceae bacterium]|nr:membrane protein insertase YidC [Nevskiaceae bacterium]MDI3261064.1 membrane protein insertase YidC [Nevskiaceae bacterium]